MKTIYIAVMERLKTKVTSLKWIDLDTGQLESAGDRPAVAFPCALLTIEIPRADDITDLDQDCEARITVRLAFNQEMRTNSAAPVRVIDAAMNPYDVIASAYAALQGWGNASFEPLSRTSQGKENSRTGLFVYRMVFKTRFEDQTAE